MSSIFICEIKFLIELEVNKSRVTIKGAFWLIVHCKANLELAEINVEKNHFKIYYRQKCNRNYLLQDIPPILKI